jgi:putative SOS response-associated peptidase YedK
LVEIQLKGEKSMCGRFTITVDLEVLRKYLVDEFDIKELKTEFSLPRYNVAPGQDIITVINDGIKNRVGYLKWGFIPNFAKDEKIGYQMINAKAETLKEKPSFRKSFEMKRCVILADSYYEWKKDGNKKVPMRILLNDEKLFLIAGLYSTFVKADGTKLHTCTIITTSSNELTHQIHERMPVILSSHEKDHWLNPKVSDLDLLSNLLKPYPSYMMKAYPVSTVVNNASNDVFDCIKKVS